MRRAVGLAVTLLCVWYGAAAAQAAGTVSCVPADDRGGVTKITCSWTADGSGNVSGNAYAVPVTGMFFKIEIVPGSGGSQPTDLYDITVLDALGADTLAGFGVDASSSTVRLGNVQAPGVWLGRDSTLTVTISGAGVSKSGTLYLWINTLAKNQ